LTVLGPDGEPLGEETSAFLATLPTEGPYTVVAQGYVPDRAGYTLSLLELTGEFGSMAYEETRSDTIEAASGDYWTFVGHPGEAAMVAVESGSAALVLELYDPLGALIAERTSDGGVPIEVSAAIRHSGTHILVLRGPDAGSSVAYSLSLTEAEAMPIVVWTAYVDWDEEYAYVLDVLSNHAGVLPYLVVETATRDPDELARLLEGQSLLLIPEQEVGGDAVGQVAARLGPAVEAFVRMGGRVVAMNDRSYYGNFLSAMGLLDAFSSDADVDGEELSIVEPDHPLAQNLPDDWLGANATAAYQVENTDATVVVESAHGDAVVVSRPLGDGEVILIGFDYYESNQGADQLLVNAVFGPR
jgi:hypothetical protein